MQRSKVRAPPAAFCCFFLKKRSFPKWGYSPAYDGSCFGSIFSNPQYMHNFFFFSNPQYIFLQYILLFFYTISQIIYDFQQNVILSYATWRLENCILAGSCADFIVVFGNETQNSRMAEACWAHNPEVDGSKPCIFSCCQDTFFLFQFL